ncbi:MAG: TolC family protein [Gammaproteobacteria bacterium]|nr:TolC family protein [Gammaproteobacteria bacterium]
MTVVLAGLATANTITVAAAQTGHTEHSHQRVSEDTSLTLRSAVEQALAHYPEYLMLAAYDQQAGDLRAYGAGLLSGAPSVAMRYQSDAATGSNGLREYEVGLNLPLWNPGQRAAARNLGGAATDQAAARQAMMIWQVAGEVRTALWDIAVAQNALNASRDGLAVAERVADSVTRRYEAGDIPRSDTLLAAAAVLEQQSDVVDKEALLVDAERGYYVLTGVPMRPAFELETLADIETLPPDHPGMALAEAEIAQAQAQLSLQRKSVRGNPSLQIGPRRERSVTGGPNDDSIGVTLQIPFGGSRSTRAQTSTTALALAQAEADRLRRLREYELALHEAHHSLDAYSNMAELAAERAKLDETHAAMARTAFNQGELPLVEYLRFEQAAVASRTEASRLALLVKRTVAEVNQAAGILP